jgi:hypothetical protein
MLAGARSAVTHDDGRKHPRHCRGKLTMLDNGRMDAHHTRATGQQRAVLGDDLLKGIEVVNQLASRGEQRDLLRIRLHTCLGHLGQDLSNQPLTWGLCRLLPCGHDAASNLLVVTTGFGL